MRNTTAYISLAVLLICFFVDFGGYTRESNTLSHFLYIFSHGNIWHLLGNAYALFLVLRHSRILPQLLLPGGIVIAFVCSFFAYTNLPTVGASGAIYAMIGASMYGSLSRRHLFIVIPIIIGFLFPFNALLHLYCFFAGLLIMNTYSFIYQSYAKYRRVIE